jgi:hypothetical protein
VAAGARRSCSVAARPSSSTPAASARSVARQSSGPISAVPLAGIRVVEFTPHGDGSPPAAWCWPTWAPRSSRSSRWRRPHAHAAGLGRRLLPDVQPQQAQHHARPARRARRERWRCECCAGADVFSENFKPGTMDQAGLDHEALARLNPRLVYVSHKGFLPGPYEQRTALDEVVQMMGGLAYMTGRPGDPLRAGSSVNDIMGGLFGAIGVLAALRSATHHGRGGQEVQSALFENNVLLVASTCCSSP